MKLVSEFFATLLHAPVLAINFEVTTAPSPTRIPAPLCEPLWTMDLQHILMFAFLALIAFSLIAVMIQNLKRNGCASSAVRNELVAFIIITALFIWVLHYFPTITPCSEPYLDLTVFITLLGAWYVYDKIRGCSSLSRTLFDAGILFCIPFLASPLVLGNARCNESYGSCADPKYIQRPFTYSLLIGSTLCFGALALCIKRINGSKTKPGKPEKIEVETSKPNLNKRRFSIPWLAVLFITVAALAAAYAYKVSKVAPGAVLPSGIPAIVSETYNELYFKHSDWPIQQFNRCTKGTETIYNIGIHGGFGSGEMYIFSDKGDEVYYRQCDTAPTDGCLLRQERGVKPDLRTYQCSNASEPYKAKESAGPLTQLENIKFPSENANEGEPLLEDIATTHAIRHHGSANLVRDYDKDIDYHFYPANDGGFYLSASEIYRKSVDVGTSNGKGMHIDTAVSGEMSDPRMSPNGEWVSLVLRDSDKTSLWVIKNDGSNAKRVSDIDLTRNPSWTQSGVLIFVYQGSIWEYVVDIDPEVELKKVVAMPIPAGADAGYVAALKTAAYRCGAEVQFYRYFYPNNTYQFTGGKCPATMWGSAPGVKVTYDANINKVVDVVIDSSWGSIPINLSIWNISASKAVQIAVQNGAEKFLRTVKGSYLLEITYEGGKGGYEIFWGSNVDTRARMIFMIDQNTGNVDKKNEIHNIGTQPID